jgi:hypothetical protein
MVQIANPIDRCQLINTSRKMPAHTAGEKGKISTPNKSKFLSDITKAPLMTRPKVPKILSVQITSFLHSYLGKFDRKFFL